MPSAGPPQLQGERWKAGAAVEQGRRHNIFKPHTPVVLESLSSLWLGSWNPYHSMSKSWRLVHMQASHFTTPHFDECSRPYKTLRLQGLIFEGFWAQRPNYAGLLGHFEPQGKIPEVNPWRSESSVRGWSLPGVSPTRGMGRRPFYRRSPKPENP